MGGTNSPRACSAPPASHVNSHSRKAGLECPGSFRPALWPLRALGLSRLLVLHSRVQLLIASLCLEEVLTVTCLEPGAVASTCRCQLWEYRVEVLGTSP